MRRVLRALAILQVLEDLRLGKFKLNPKIQESKFKASDPAR
jgi:hypothetical protein